ncbi:hypothetical protein [Pseudooceanicola sp.]|uniref:hypothetical protein n=1 Tax=Pseudooceanicola sp. TaxID=1914328 RepID=UPI0026053B60|nr:hypothetical protein [Pseudooceanicola sp.]MDF1854407.1 hypothetical protein [Pseudooceanicola sp.]
MTDTTLSREAIARFNAEKPLFTAGPASLIYENVAALRPCFGRGDSAFLTSYDAVLTAISGIAGQSRTVAMQGSGSSAIEVMIANFLYGKVLVVDSGYYAKRLKSIAESRARRDGFIQSVEVVDWQQIDEVAAPYDWVLSVYAETSEAVLVPIAGLEALSKRCGAKLALDATASIGLEPGHDVADVTAFSSCKGLFGLTGAGFIAYSCEVPNQVEDMIAALSTYADRKTTGPYHAILSLEPILANHGYFKEAVTINKAAFCRKFADHLIYPAALQPQLCTATSAPIRASNPNAVLYAPRETRAASITCHIGEVHLGAEAKGALVDMLEIG